MIGREVGENLPRFIARQHAKNERFLFSAQSEDEICYVGRIQLCERIAQLAPVVIVDCGPQSVAEHRQRCRFGHRGSPAGELNRSTQHLQREKINLR